MQNGTGAKITKKQATWLEHLRACTASGETLTSYAATHELRPQQLYRWKRRLQALGLLEKSRDGRRSAVRSETFPRRPADLGFIAARLAASDDRHTRSGLRIHFRNGVVLEVDVSCTGVLDADLLSQLAALP